MNMTTVEQRDLAEQEAIIERHYQGFVQVGLALLAIREGKLWKATEWATFDEYCQERWGIGLRQAQRTIQAAKAVEAIDEGRPIGHVPQNEHQARILIASTAKVPEMPIIPVDRNAIRCKCIMDELVSNPDLARLVRIELMKWYALNG